MKQTLFVCDETAHAYAGEAVSKCEALASIFYFSFSQDSLRNAFS